VRIVGLVGVIEIIMVTVVRVVMVSAGHFHYRHTLVVGILIENYHYRHLQEIVGRIRWKV
jgi:hypothetical protein